MMTAIKETVVAGKTIHTTIKYPSGRHTGSRAKRRNVTPEKVRKNNDRLAERNLWLLINHNFDENSGSWTLTYEGDDPEAIEAEKTLTSFIRRLRYRMKKIGEELKYIVTTEVGARTGRIHHHFICNTLNVELISSCWKQGFVRLTKMDNSGDYKKLAGYIIKRTKDTFREEGSVCKRRYKSSRNLKKPVIKREEVSIKSMNEDPKPLKGYEIIKDSVRWYEHPVTGLEHLEYVQIALDKPRKYKVYPRGRIVSGKEYYKADRIEEQLGFDVREQ